MQIKYYSFLLFFVFAIIYPFPLQEWHFVQRVVVIDPAGDARRTGRRIGDSFERGLTLQCAEKIKEIIEERASYIKLIITRMPGDHVYDLQNATLANRIADCFINLNFYYTQETKPTIFLYQFSYGNDFAACQQGLALYSYDQAYRINKNATDRMCLLCKHELSQQKYHSLFTVAGPYSLPIKPLIGVIAPTISCEIGLKSKELWHYCSEPLAQAIITVVGEME